MAGRKRYMKKHDSIMEEMDKARVESLVSLMNEKNVTFEELKTLIENRQNPTVGSIFLSLIPSAYNIFLLRYLKVRTAHITASECCQISLPGNSAENCGRYAKQTLRATIQDYKICNK